MRCPRCGGTAYAYACEDENGKMPIKCPWCGYSEVQTNEEWFDNLPTDEKAKIMIRLVNNLEKRELISDWLKGVHKE